MAHTATEFARRIRFLHGLAEEARVVAERMHDLTSRRSMFTIAASYERMAEHLEIAQDHLSLPITPSPRLCP